MCVASRIPQSSAGRGIHSNSLKYSYSLILGKKEGLGMMKCWRMGDCGVTQGTKEQLIVTCSELLSAVRGQRYLWNLKIDAREED